MITLQKICINPIVKEFERFYLAFKETNDAKFRKNFELLQRKFSYELLSELFQARNLKDEYLGILLNEHLKYLDGQWILRDYNDDMVLRQINVTFTEAIVSRLPNLRKISLLHYCVDEDMRNIAVFCPKITEIDVTCSRVTDNGIRYLCKDDNGKFPCPELRKLFINRSKVTDDGVEYLLKNLPSLEMIDKWQRIPILLHSLHADFPHRVYNLTSLNFYGVNTQLPNYYNDVLVTCLNVCPKLKSLEKCCILHEQQLNLLSTFNLEKLDLMYIRANQNIHLSIYFRNVNRCNLTYLTVENCIVSIYDLAVNCPKLKCLNLIGVLYQDNDDLQGVFHSLVEPTFVYSKNDSSTNKAILSILQFSPKLECIRFTLCVLSPDIKIHILKLCENHLMKKISFSHTNVEMQFLKSILSSCPPSMILNINGNDIFFRDVKELADFAETLPNKPQVTVYEEPLGTLHDF